METEGSLRNEFVATFEDGCKNFRAGLELALRATVLEPKHRHPLLWTGPDPDVAVDDLTHGRALLPAVFRVGRIELRVSLCL